MQLLLLFNTGLVIAGGLTKRILVDKSNAVGPVEDLWNDIFDVRPAAPWQQLTKDYEGHSESQHILRVPHAYVDSFQDGTGAAVPGCQPTCHLNAVLGLCCAQVLIVWFGEFPEVPRGLPQQAFSIAMAVTGLAAFAIVLALVEQLVLQILTENVSRGSQVYEKGHILVLAWAWTQRDREVIWKILSQASPHPQDQQAACRAASRKAGAYLRDFTSASCGHQPR